jgi:hypothetical protein
LTNVNPSNRTAVEKLIDSIFRNNIIQQRVRGQVYQKLPNQRIVDDCDVYLDRLVLMAGRHLLRVGMIQVDREVTGMSRPGA